MMRFPTTFDFDRKIFRTDQNVDKQKMVLSTTISPMFDEKDLLKLVQV